MQLLSSLYKARLIRLLQHLLGVAHQTAVLQHALVLLHLGRIFKTPEQFNIWLEISGILRKTKSQYKMVSFTLKQISKKTFLLVILVMKAQFFNSIYK